MPASNFWGEYLKKLKEDCVPFEALECYKGIMREAQYQFKQAISNFEQELAKIPIGAEIENWLRSLDLPEDRVSKVEISMLQLINHGLLKLTHNGQVCTLKELSSRKHQEIIEEIRCSPKLTLSEKEGAVAAYIAFSQHLSRVTHGFISQGEDPNIQRTLKKTIWYKNFIQLIQSLPERDALIAKLLYFGAPTMDEVLDMRVGQVNVKTMIVKFNKFPVKYPKHIMLELKNYLSKKEKDELVFVNMRGERVERTHLNNCFNRASRKIPNQSRITPKMLLESDITKSLGNEPIFNGLIIP